MRQSEQIGQALDTITRWLTLSSIVVAQWLHAQSSLPDSLNGEHDEPLFSSLTHQNPLDPFPVVSRYSTESAFNRIFNTIFFRSLGSLSLQSRALRIMANASVNSTIAEFQERAIRDEIRFATDVGYVMLPWLVTKVVGSHYVLSDSRQLFRNDASISSIGGGIESNSFFEEGIVQGSRFTFSSLAGLRDEMQQGIRGNGLFFQSNGIWQGIPIGDFDLGVRGGLYDDFLGPRRNYSRSFGAMGVEQFKDANERDRALLFLSGTVEEARRDFYSLFGASEIAPTVERRIERTLSTMDSLWYEITPWLDASVQGELRFRTIRRENSQQFLDVSLGLYDNEIKQNTLSTRFSTRFHNGEWTAAAAVTYQFQSETYAPINASSDSIRVIRLEAFRNNSFEVASLSGWVKWELRDGELLCNSLSVSGQLRGFAYNTPAIENTDDRDELGYYADLADTLRLSEQFTLSILLSTAHTHTVFISAAQSANNRWNRILRLAPSVLWTPTERVASYNQFSVLANYTIYDFELPLSTRSFSFRQFMFSDSSMVYFDRSHWVKVTYEQRLYERGELFWESFSENPLNAFTDRLMTAAFHIRTPEVESAIGVRWFERTQDGFFFGARRRQQYLLYVGPTASLNVTLSRDITLFAEGWYQLEYIDNTFTRATPNLSLLVRASW